MPKKYSTNVLIIGSGPAGWTAAIYAARSNLNPIIITGDQPGGQLMVTTDVENYPGFENIIQGPWLMNQMQLQAEKCGTMIVNDIVIEVDLSKKIKYAIDSSSNTYEAKSVIIATGAQAKWLGIDSETKFRGHGVSGCATCDAFFFKNKVVAIVGGGNTAAEEAIYLTNHAQKVYIVHRGNKMRAEKVLQDRIFANEKIEIIWNSEIDEILGEEKPLKFVTGIRVKDVLSGDTKITRLDGVFIAIGHKPNTAIFINKIDLDAEGYIIANSDTSTNIQGVFAAGDVQDKVYRQAITAAGTGCIAALEANKYLDEYK